MRKNRNTNEQEQRGSARALRRQGAPAGVAAFASAQRSVHWLEDLDKQISSVAPELIPKSTLVAESVTTVIYESSAEDDRDLQLFACDNSSGHLNIGDQVALRKAVAESLSGGDAILLVLPAAISAGSLLSLYSEGITEVVVSPSPSVNADLLLKHISSARARHRYHGKLRLNAETDPLTKALNRRAFETQLRQAEEQASRENTTLAVFYIDLDYFKDANDRFGHAIGDKVLMEACKRLKDELRASDFLARMGGDEFAALLVGASPRQALKIGQRMVQSMRRVMKFDECDVLQTCSVGVAVTRGEAAPGEISLLKRADKALYNAKTSGRDQVTCCYDSDHFSSQSVAPALHLTDDWNLASDLRAAIDSDDQLSLVYQPQVDIHSGGIHGMEALIRWEHPHYGPISPAEFIPRAEQCGLILPIGQYVRQTASKQLKSWQRDCDLAADFKLCINVSAVEFHQQSYFASMLCDLSSLSESIELELTETAIGNHSQTLSRRMQAIRDAGMQLALDDFGTGSSSLSHVTKLPVNTIKVDKSFVQATTTDQRAAAVVEGIYTLADRLDIRVVAEGIETHKDWAFLRTIGGSDAQGFLFSAGVSSKAATDLLQQKFIRPATNATLSQ